ncbi:MAG: hypothetical protein CSA76_02230 [Spirochaetales bacterium]|nr:MAG: hypothetical protein CSA76_02230 [Spirochaetales bacterium]
MTKDRLRTFTSDELFKIAQQENIGVSPDMDKEALVSLVFDALEDERADREGNYNLTIRLAATKFAVSQDEEFFLDFESDTELLRRYKESCLVLILRDPSWVFCYWDLEDRILAKLLEHSGYSGLFLRIIEFSENSWDKKSSEDWFDIPIQFSDMSRYINLPGQDSYYGAELYARLGEDKKMLVRSNIIHSSRDSAVSGPAGTGNEDMERLIALSGMSSDVGQFPGTHFPESLSPQRIIGNEGENNGR